LRNRAIWSGAVRWPCCCIYIGRCEHPGTGWWPLRKAEAVRALEMTVLVHNCRRTTCTSHEVLCHKVDWSAFKRRLMWRISAKLILNCTRTMWKNEQLKIGRWQLDLWHRL
jgi:hypothetical protein